MISNTGLVAIRKIEGDTYVLVFLPLEAGRDESPQTLLWYYSYQRVVRGTEARRNDARNFIKEFQTELVYTLFDCKDSADVASKVYENALLLVTKMIDKGEDWST